MASPRPIPTALKILRGNPGKRALNHAEPQPTVGRPTCPTWLDIEAKREWRRVVPELEALGILTVVDRAALAAYCQSYARWQQAEAVVTELGFSVPLTRRGEDGELTVYAMQSRPEVGISQKERQIMRLFLTEFGLTPSSRTRVKVAEKKTADPFEQWANGTPSPA